MIHERALVLDRPSKNESKVWVRTQRQSACDSCKLKSGCGQSALSKLSGDKSMELEVKNSLGARAGDVVILAIPEEGILTASLVMYFVPLVLMVLLAIVASSIGLGELAIIFSGGVGLAVGFWAARTYSHKHQDDPRFNPVMSSLALASTADAACV